jgi:putative aldouronate transport system permease protein
MSSNAVQAPSLCRETFGHKLYRSRVLLLMCFPAILFFFLFSYLPMPGAYIAFTKFNYNKGIFASPFIGWKNFAFLFSSGQLSLLLRNTVLTTSLRPDRQFLQVTFAILLTKCRANGSKKPRSP